MEASLWMATEKRNPYAVYFPCSHHSWFDLLVRVQIGRIWLRENSASFFATLVILTESTIHVTAWQGVKFTDIVVSMNDNQDDKMNEKLVSSHQKLTYIENVPSRSLDIWKEATIRQREIHWYRPTFESCLYKLAEANTKSRNLCARGWLRWQFCIDKTSRWRCNSRTGNNLIKLQLIEIELIDFSLYSRWNWPIQLSKKN